MATSSILEVPSRNKRIPMKTIRSLANHIAKKFNPEEIILFGSYAYGKPTAWSDVDLLVIMDTPKGEIETSLEIVKALPDIVFSVDILARSRSFISKRKRIGDRFMEEITKKGKVLYARDR